jgi:hypothetical protein
LHPIGLEDKRSSTYSKGKRKESKKEEDEMKNICGYIYLHVMYIYAPEYGSA